jgi:cystathionine beta-lyase/cystathionine gamma-synthase
MMQTEAGRKELHEAGISPHLLRLSVGLEDTGDIIRALERALEYA